MTEPKTKVCPRCSGPMTRRAKMCGECSKKRTGSDHPSWKGGRNFDYYGYVRVSSPGHPHAKGDGSYIPEHKLVIEKKLGRYLVPGENIHHLNGDRADNRIENLELWSTTQPRGQRIEDKVDYALEILALYAPERLKDNDASA